MNSNSILNQYKTFLDNFFVVFDRLGVETGSFAIDHVAYQAASTEDYEKLKPLFVKLGSMVSESVVGGRRVGIVKLDSPLKYGKYTISAVELIEPKKGQVCESDWQHVEFVIDVPLQEFANKHSSVDWDLAAIDRDEFPKVQHNFPNGFGVKFHTESVLEEVSKYG